jgi:DNA-binding response OmpR family regulator
MPRILVIEDEVDVTKVLEKRLKDAGYEPVIANDSSTGVDLAHSARPDAIILDLMLPAGGGMAILRGLKLAPETRDIPVVVLTGVRNEQVRQNVIKEGAAAYVQKPYEPAELAAVLRNVLGKDGGSRRK